MAGELDVFAKSTGWICNAMPLIDKVPVYILFKGLQCTCVQLFCARNLLNIEKSQTKNYATMHGSLLYTTTR